jgi:hypothetical protein
MNRTKPRPRRVVVPVAVTLLVLFGAWTTLEFLRSGVSDSTIPKIAQALGCDRLAALESLIDADGAVVLVRRGPQYSTTSAVVIAKLRHGVTPADIGSALSLDLWEGFGETPADLLPSIHEWGPTAAVHVAGTGQRQYSDSDPLRGCSRAFARVLVLQQDKEMLLVARIN